MLASFPGSRAFRVGLAGAVLLAATGCATRCRLTPVDTFSNQLDARVSWDSSGAPQYHIIAVYPWDDLQARAAAKSTSRVILSAAVVDACGNAVAGNAWSRQLDLAARTNAAFFEQRVRLATVAGPQRLTLATLVQGEAYGALWQRTYDLAVLSASGLALEPPEFWTATAPDTTEPTWNVARYYDESTGAPLVRATLHDRAATAGAVYHVRSRVRAQDDSIVHDGEFDVPQAGSRTTFEVPIPVRGLGRHVLELTVREGTRLASTAGEYDVGVADLASWGGVEAGRELLALLFTDDEIAAVDAAPAPERAAAWERLWRGHDPDAATPRNEFRDTIRQRIQVANVRFSEGRPGWQTDRGRVYVVWGPPEQADSFESPNALDRTERWTYDAGNTVFVFVDAWQTGEYVLKRTNAARFLERLRRQR